MTSRRFRSALLFAAVCAATVFGVCDQLSAAPNPESNPRASITRTSITRTSKPRLSRYVVAPGETLTAISLHFGVTIAEIERANPAVQRRRTLLVGQVLQVPLPPPESKTGLPRAIRDNPSRLRLRPVIRRWAAKNNIAPDLVEATLYLESGWNQERVSSTGAVGVGQLMPATASFIRRDLIGPKAGGAALSEAVVDHNIRMSARYLRHLLGVTNGNVDRALYGYYQGLGSVAEHGVYDDAKSYASAVRALRSRFRNDLTGV